MEPLASYAAECIECGLASYVRCNYCGEAVCSDHRYDELCLLCAPGTPICDHSLAIGDRVDDSNPDLDSDALASGSQIPTTWQDFNQSPDNATLPSGSQSTTCQYFNLSPDDATLPSGSQSNSGEEFEERCQKWREQVEVFWATGPFARRQTAQIQEPPVPATWQAFNQSWDDAPTWQDFDQRLTNRRANMTCGNYLNQSLHNTASPSCHQHRRPPPPPPRPPPPPQQTDNTASPSCRQHRRPPPPPPRPPPPPLQTDNTESPSHHEILTLVEFSDKFEFMYISFSLDTCSFDFTGVDGCNFDPHNSHNSPYGSPRIDDDRDICFLLNHIAANHLSR